MSETQQDPKILLPREVLEAEEARQHRRNFDQLGMLLPGDVLESFFITCGRSPVVSSMLNRVHEDVAAGEHVLPALATALVRMVTLYQVALAHSEVRVALARLSRNCFRAAVEQLPQEEAAKVKQKAIELFNRQAEALGLTEYKRLHDQTAQVLLESARDLVEALCARVIEQGTALTTTDGQRAIVNEYDASTGLKTVDVELFASDVRAQMAALVEGNLKRTAQHEEALSPEDESPDLDTQEPEGTK